MFNLLKSIKGRNLWLLYLSFFLTFIQVLTDVAQPFLLLYLTRSNSTTSFFYQTNDILAIGGGMLGLSILGLIVGGFATVISSKVGVRFGSITRLNLLNKIQSLSFADIDYYQPSSLITRLTNDVVFVQNTVILSVRIIVRAFLLFIGGLILSYVISPVLASIFLASCVVILVAILIVIFKAIPLFKKQQKEVDKTNGIMRESLLGIRVIKAFNMQSNQVTKFDVQNNLLKNRSILAQRVSVIIMPIILFVVQSSVIVVMMAAGVNPRAFAGNNIGVIVALTQIISLIVVGLVSIVIVLMNISNAKASSDRINEILNAKPSLQKTQSNNLIKTSDVEFKNVSFSYFPNSKDAEPSLKNISFKTKIGETIGIIGATGSGKTTLINLITRMYDVTQGEILISGINIKDIDNNSLRKSISVSPQKVVLFSGTIASNIKYGKEDATEKELIEACQDAQAIEFINKKEGKLEAIVEQRGTNFSGGQKQRISIARALIKKPKILILDDTTSALDLLTEAKVQDSFKKYKDTTIFMIGQRISSISKADRIIVLDKGEIVGFGSHNELIKKCLPYKEIADSQERVK